MTVNLNSLLLRKRAMLSSGTACEYGYHFQYYRFIKCINELNRKLSPFQTVSSPNFFFFFLLEEGVADKKEKLY